MNWLFSHSWLRPLAQFALAGLIGIGAGWPAEAGAATMSAAQPSSPPTPGKSADHHCRCGPNCRGATCCCSPARAKPRPEAVVRPDPGRVAARSDLVKAGPCWKAAPCGDGAPAPSAVGPVERAVMLADARPWGAPRAREFAAIPAAGVVPGRRADRIDDPPEAHPSA